MPILKFPPALCILDHTQDPFLSSDKSGEFAVLVANGEMADAVTFNVGHSPCEIIICGEGDAGRDHQIKNKQRIEELRVEHGGKGFIQMNNALKISVFIKNGVDVAGGTF